MEIAHDLHGLAHVGGHDVDQRPVDRPPLGESHDGDVDPFFEDVPPVRRQPPPADIDDMAGTREQRHRPALAKGRRHEGEVVQVAGPLPRIVGQEYVAFLHRPDREAFEEVAHRPRHRVDMPGCAGHRLGEHPPFGVEHPRRQVSRLAGRGGEAGADERLGLLLHHRDQAVPHELEPDGRERVGAGHRGSLAIRMLSSASTDAEKD